MQIVEINGKLNLFSYPKGLNDGIAITTNGCWKKDGTAVMGKGIALEACRRLIGVESVLGARLKHSGNHVYNLGTFELDNRFGRINTKVFSFPTKYHWKDASDLDLIVRSAKELVNLVNKLNLESVYMTVPGCANGGLRWCAVKPAIQEILDDRFIVIKDSYVKE